MVYGGEDAQRLEIFKTHLNAALSAYPPAYKRLERVLEAAERHLRMQGLTALLDSGGLQASIGQLESIVGLYEQTYQEFMSLRGSAIAKQTDLPETLPLRFFVQWMRPSFVLASIKDRFGELILAQLYIDLQKLQREPASDAKEEAEEEVYARVIKFLDDCDYILRWYRTTLQVYGIAEEARIRLPRKEKVTANDRITTISDVAINMARSIQREDLVKKYLPRVQ